MSSYDFISHAAQGFMSVQRTALKSRLVRAIYYDEASFLMAVQMRTGGLRVYRQVSPDLFEDFGLHPAPGVFYDEVVRWIVEPVSPMQARALIFRFRIWLLSREADRVDAV